MDYFTQIQSHIQNNVARKTFVVPSGGALFFEDMDIDGSLFLRSDRNSEHEFLVEIKTTPITHKGGWCVIAETDVMSWPENISLSYRAALRLSRRLKLSDDHAKPLLDALGSVLVDYSKKNILRLDYTLEHSAGYSIVKPEFGMHRIIVDNPKLDDAGKPYSRISLYETISGKLVDALNVTTPEFIDPSNLWVRPISQFAEILPWLEEPEPTPDPMFEWNGPSTEELKAQLSAELTVIIQAKTDLLMSPSS